MTTDTAEDYAQEPGGRLVLMAAVFAGIDFLAGALLPRLDSEYFVYPSAGMMAGQWGLLTVWTALGQGPLLVRFAKALVTAVLLFAALVLGVATYEVRPAPTEVIVAPLLFPLMLLTAQLPIWIFTELVHCRLTSSETNRDIRSATNLLAPELSVRSGQFGLQQMLIMTGVLSLALGLTRTWCGLVGSPDEAAELLTGLGVAIAMQLGMVALAVVPCLAAAVYFDNWPTRLRVLGIYSLILSIAVMLAIWRISGGGFFHSSFVIMTLLFHGALFITLLAPLAFGCEIVQEHERQPPPSLQQESKNNRDIVAPQAEQDLS